MNFFMAGKPTWNIRRRVVISTLLWCSSLVTYLAVWGRDASVAESAVNGCLLLMASVIGSYVFGAVWDDKNQSGSVSVESYQKTSVSTDDSAPPAGPKE